MVEFGTAVELDGEQIVPTQVGGMSLQVPLSDVEELAMGVVGARIDDAIVPSPTRPGCFSISLNAVGLTRVVVTRKELDLIVQRCRVITNMA
jgi:hypothetical protein